MFGEKNAIAGIFLHLPPGLRLILDTPYHPANLLSTLSILSRKTGDQTNDNYFIADKLYEAKKGIETQKT